MRVLVVEDEPLVAMLLEEILDDLGHTVVGPAASVQEGLTMAEGGHFDGAILDVNLNGARSYPIADLLKSKSIPYFFATGYGSAEGVVERGVEIVKKPFSEDVLAAALKRILPSRSPSTAS
jgi:CheY-like chemotaxis protein